MIFIPCASASAVLCTIYLLCNDEKRIRKKIMEVVWILPCICYAVLSCVFNTDAWNYSETTQWAVRGEITRGPGFQIVAYFFAMLLIALISSYLVARILRYVIVSIRAKKNEQPLANGEKRAHGTLFRPVCYCCNKPKSIMHDYPSKICGQRICFECLDKMHFKSLPTELSLAAFDGKPPFKTADDVIRYLKENYPDD